MFNPFRKQPPPSGPYYFVVSHDLSESTKQLAEDLIGAIGKTGILLTAIQNLERKVNTMSDAIDRIEREAQDLADNVPVIKQAIADLKTVIKDLQDQIAQGQLDQARLEAAATKLEQVDSDTDAIFAPETPAEPQSEG